MNRRVTGVLSRGIIGPSTETNIFFLRDCAHRAFAIRVLNIRLFLDLGSFHPSARSIYLILTLASHTFC